MALGPRRRRGKWLKVCLFGPALLPSHVSCHRRWPVDFDELRPSRISLGEDERQQWERKSRKKVGHCTRRGYSSDRGFDPIIIVYDSSVMHGVVDFFLLGQGIADKVPGCEHRRMRNAHDLKNGTPSTTLASYTVNDVGKRVGCGPTHVIKWCLTLLTGALFIAGPTWLKRRVQKAKYEPARTCNLLTLRRRLAEIMAFSIECLIGPPSPWVTAAWNKGPVPLSNLLGISRNATGDTTTIARWQLLIKQ